MSRFSLLLLVALAAFAGAAQQRKKPPIVLTRELLNLCKGQPSITTNSEQKRLKWMVAASGEASVLLKSSAQHQAACWMLYTDSASKGRSESHFLQRYAVAVLHFATTKSNTTAWDWQMAVDEPWAIGTAGRWMRPRLHECSWYGVRCYWRTKQIHELDLGYLKLDGLIPREVSLLTGLKDLDLHANDFQGIVPLKLSFLHNLEYLRLHMNGLFGSLQPEMVHWKKLKELHLFGNYFGGSVPAELSKLTHLEVIDLYANQFDGQLPSSIGKLKKLKYLDVHDNNLTGSVPKEICNLKLPDLIADCLGPKPEVKCDCCTICCRGLPDFKCVDVKTGNEIVYHK
jgi:hypothetical protein